jgi:hypothetical protein
MKLCVSLPAVASMTPEGERLTSIDTPSFYETAPGSAGSTYFLLIIKAMGIFVMEDGPLVFILQCCLARVGR